MAAQSQFVQVTLQRRSGAVDLLRPDAKTGTLTQPGQPDRRIALHRRSVRDCLAEELRRLDPDEIYEAALKAVPKVTKGRTVTPSPAKAASPAKPAAAAKAKAPAKAAEAPAAEAKPKRAASKKATAKAES